MWVLTLEPLKNCVIPQIFGAGKFKQLVCYPYPDDAIHT